MCAQLFETNSGKCPTTQKNLLKKLVLLLPNAKRQLRCAFDTCRYRFSRESGFWLSPNIDGLTFVNTNKWLINSQKWNQSLLINAHQRLAWKYMHSFVCPYGFVTVTSLLLRCFSMDLFFAWKKSQSASIFWAMTCHSALKLPRRKQESLLEKWRTFWFSSVAKCQPWSTFP